MSEMVRVPIKGEVYTLERVSVTTYTFNLMRQDGTIAASVTQDTGDALAALAVLVPLLP